MIAYETEEYKLNNSMEIRVWKIGYLKASFCNRKLFQYMKIISISKVHILKTVKSLQTFSIF